MGGGGSGWSGDSLGVALTCGRLRLDGIPKRNCSGYSELPSDQRQAGHQGVAGGSDRLPGAHRHLACHSSDHHRQADSDVAASKATWHAGYDQAEHYIVPPAGSVAFVLGVYVGSQHGAVLISDFGVAAETAGGGSRLLWTSWQNYPKVMQGGREYAQIGDRLYTRHAVDRMQPGGLGATAGAAGPGRSISPDFVEDVLGSTRGVPVKGPAGEARLSYTSGSVQVITEDGIA